MSPLITACRSSLSGRPCAKVIISRALATGRGVFVSSCSPGCYVNSRSDPLSVGVSWHFMPGRAGENGEKMIEYCPHCGATKFMSYRHGDLLMCKTCASVVSHGVLMRTRVRAELPRLVVASLWLSGRQGDFTRAELARHLGLTNSPYLRAAVADLVDRGLLVVSCAAHPQNGRPAQFYRRPGAWRRADVARRCWSAGAAV